MGTIVKGLFLVLLLGLIGIQFVPVERSNPPVTGEIAARDEVLAVLKRSCYDCHSNETRWPWYSRVAPVSWQIAEHVRDGRSRMNFSEWQELSAEERDDLMGEIWEEVEDGGMPLPIYLRMHPEAVLTESHMDALRRWVAGEEPQFPDWN